MVLNEGQIISALVLILPFDIKPSDLMNPFLNFTDGSEPRQHFSKCITQHQHLLCDSRHVTQLLCFSFLIYKVKMITELIIHRVECSVYQVLNKG